MPSLVRFWYAGALKAVLHHTCPDAHGNTLTAVACQLSRPYLHTVQRHPLKTFLFVEGQADREEAALRGRDGRYRMD